MSRLVRNEVVEPTIELFALCRGCEEGQREGNRGPAVIRIAECLGKAACKSDCRLLHLLMIRLHQVTTLAAIDPVIIDI